jgi:5,6,7,8-tetrahydromethanopterin hydro-lyase
MNIENSSIGTLKVDRVLVGEALVGDGNESAHIELIMGPRGSYAEAAFCNAMTNQKCGANALLALVAPNLMAKPSTVMYNKVELSSEKQVNQMFGPAQRGVARGVTDCVKEGLIPQDEVDNIFICIGVFVHWDARNDDTIQDFNYAATKMAISRALLKEPKIDEIFSLEHVMQHPLAAHD